MRGLSGSKMYSVEPDVRLGSVGDIEALLASRLRLLTLASISLGIGLLPEQERHASQARIDQHLSGCRCLESGVGMLIGGSTYAIASMLIPELRMSTVGASLAVGGGVALLGGAIGRILGHIGARRRVQREVRALHRVIATAPDSRPA